MKQKNKQENTSQSPAKAEASNINNRVALTYAEFAQSVGLRPATIRRLCAAGDIRVTRINSLLQRIPASELALFA